MDQVNPGTAQEVASRVDADTILVNTRLVLGDLVGDAERTVVRGDPDFARYESELDA